MPRPQVLLFDLGGVLVDNVTFDELPALLPEPIEDGELRGRWLYSPSVQGYERGALTTDEFTSAFIEEWRVDCGAADFLDHFASWPRGPYPGALELLDRLRDDYQLALLSNCNPIHWERLAPIRERVHVSFSSHLLGKVKPDPGIFRLVADRLGVAPGSICFFDDSVPNVEAARSVGMEAYTTRGITELVRAIADVTRAIRKAEIAGDR